MERPVATTCTLKKIELSTCRELFLFVFQIFSIFTIGIESCYTNSDNSMKILLDPGHGINTTGKRSPDGRFLEYRFNREVSRLIISDLLDRGFDCETIVPEETDISLQERCARVNRHCRQLGIDILRHTLCPAVLTENGFFTNVQEVQFLLSRPGIRAIADLHVEGIVEYLTAI